MRLPYRDCPALTVSGAGVVLAARNGAGRAISTEEARDLLAGGDVLVCHAHFVAARLATRLVRAAFDVAELFAFVRPATPFLPSPEGLVRALGLPAQGSASLAAVADTLLDNLARLNGPDAARARIAAAQLAKAGWRWGDTVLAVTGAPDKSLGPLAGLDVWRDVPEWEDGPPPGRPGSEPVSAQDAVTRLHVLRGPHGTLRRSQESYAAAAAAAFAPRERAGSPRIALVEAGTGTGKTLGYLAPASLWAERNGPGLWISTYTRNLQRQILQESARLYPHTDDNRDTVVLRKGRENYVCLLNFEDGAKRAMLAGGQRMVSLLLIARWIAASGDGDITGIGFPAFLASSLPLRELTDRRGECVYAACPHYRVCFIERAVRRARGARIVIANHALVMAQAVQDGLRFEEADDVAPERRLRYVFDEGHHLFDAADSAFASALSGNEMAELRRWIRGPEGRAGSRARGLAERVRDLLPDDADALAALDAAVNAAGALAAEGWLARLRAGNARNDGEAFLAHVHAHVRARASGDDVLYTVEAEVRPLSPGLRDSARTLNRALLGLTAPLSRVAAGLRKRLDVNAATLDSSTRVRLEAAARGIERRARLLIPAWRAMLSSLDEEPSDQPEFSNWFEIVRDDGRDWDAGLRRHWIDPTIPFTETILKSAHGALITSATLRDSGGNTDEDADWRAAEVRVGAHHLPEPPLRARFGSPFDWSEQAIVLVVRDVNRRDATALAAAYRELFLAAGGGALGLFTAVRALRAVHAGIAEPLARHGLTLYAQHIDALDTGTLVDLFRAGENTCLLGTDALRDGVDVPGRSLRLCVFDKVPWPKPSILHKARRERFGRSYDDLLARLRLKQAFGRLIRTETDKGVFVILDAACPSRLLTALPPETPVVRCTLAEAVAHTRKFLGMEPPDAAAAAISRYEGSRS